MNGIQWNRSTYLIDGKPAFLVSGEFHYFRVPRGDWERRLRLFREAGGNCVATYIPWLLHEPVEGDIRFGDTPYRDLEAFLDCCQEAGLHVLCRPGPYQYSEMKYDGLPGWLCGNYPEILARDIDGRTFRASSVSYLHPVFLEKVRRWFAAVCPILARHTVSNGGPVAFVQFDNEMAGIHEWFGGWDYHPDTLELGREDGRYARFLRARHGGIDRVNRAHGANFPSLADCRPLPPQAPVTRPVSKSGSAEDPDSGSASPTDAAEVPAAAPTTDTIARTRAKDYQDFYFGMLAEYAGLLSDWFDAYGIRCDRVHNAANPGMNAYFLETKRRLEGRFVLGSDHYYNLDMDWDQNSPSPQYASKVLYSNEMLRLMGFPPTVFELPGGSASEWPPMNPEDLHACYLANVAFGMKGLNYYIYTGGPNPEGIGSNGDSYDYGAAIAADGTPRPAYAVLKAFGAFLTDNSWLAAAEAAGDFALGLDWEQSRCAGGSFAIRDGGLSGDEAWTFLRKGLMISALCASYMPHLVDLDDADSLAALRQSGRPLLVASATQMGRTLQENLVRFVREGGRLLLAPGIPEEDECFRPCTILKDFLDGASAARCGTDYPRATLGGIANILPNGSLWRAATRPAGAVRIGTEEESDAEIAWRKDFPGGGCVLWCGLHWKHAKREHEALIRHLLGELGCAEPVVLGSNPNVWAVLRTDGTHRMVFAMNLFSAPLDTTLEIRQPDGSRLPLEPLRLAPMEVRTIRLPDLA